MVSHQCTVIKGKWAYLSTEGKLFNSNLRVGPPIAHTKFLLYIYTRILFPQKRRNCVAALTRLALALLNYHSKIRITYCRKNRISIN